MTRDEKIEKLARHLCKAGGKVDPDARVATGVPFRVTQPHGDIQAYLVPEVTTPAWHYWAQIAEEAIDALEETGS